MAAAAASAWARRLLSTSARHACADGGMVVQDASKRPKDLLALPFQDLSKVVGGTGRARMVWNLLCKGHDPMHMAREVIQESKRVPADSTWRDLAETAQQLKFGIQGGERDLRKSVKKPLAVQTAGHRSGLTIETSRVLLASGLRMPEGKIRENVLAECGTRKLLIQLQDGQHVEMVIIPSEEGSKSRRSRTTLCVSSQVGCARGCIFCATGKMGFKRNLTTGEILQQLFIAAKVTREHGLPDVSNVVFMGEGEPLNNWRNLSNAIQSILDPHIFQLAPRKVTVSTVAPSVAHVKRLQELPCAIAWSLHAADDAVRRRLVPTQSCHVQELRDAFVQVMASRGSGHHLWIGATLLSDINDSAEDALKMVQFLEPFRKSGSKAKVNLMTYNENNFKGLAPTTWERMKDFRDILMRAGYICTIRRSRGSNEGAACGQLSGGCNSDALPPHEALG